MLSIVDDIKKEIPADFNPENLERFLTRAEEYANDTEFTVDPTSALEFAAIIDGLLGRYRDQLKNSLELQKRLRALSVKLHWLSPGSIESGKKELVTTSLAQALKMGVEVLSTIQRWLDVFEFGSGPDVQRRTDFLLFLANNEEFIGTNNIKISTGESVAPTVRNWVKDYFSSLPENKTLTGGFDKIRYLTNNQNAIKLSEADKNILSQIIDIYNFLKNPEEALLRVPTNPDLAPQSPKISNIPKPQAPAALHKQNIPQQPAPTAPKPVTNFDKKLAAVTAPPMRGQDLELIRKQMEPKVSFNAKPQVAPVVKPAPVAPPAAPVKMNPDEIKREVATEELPAHQEATMPVSKPAPIPAAPIPAAPIPVAPKPVVPKGGLESLDRISIVDDLKKVDISNLRQGQVKAQTQTLRTKIISLANANKILPYYTVTAFEQSPVFKAYLQIGSEIMADSNPERVSAFKNAAAKVGSDMTMQEFEAIADLKKEIEGL